MIYCFECMECGNYVEESFGMNDVKYVVCKECDKQMARVYSVPLITGDLNYKYEYNDPTLGWVTSKRDRAEKMKRAGLRDLEYDEPQANLDREVKYIKKHARPSERSRAINSEAKTFFEKQRDERIGRAVDKAVDAAADAVSRTVDGE